MSIFADIYNTPMASLSVHDMAPAGSWESLYATLHAGADSVYFGIENLNMRSHSSNNFTINDLREIVRLCHEHKVKSYLTINTILYDEDIELMHQIVDTAQEEGISAIIAADVAVLTYARSKGVEIHLSTQLNISNVDALIFYAQFADVVVLARELTMNQVAHIFKTINDRNICGPSGNRIRIEMFCHGALCMAVSGKCYLSLHEMNKSANRGSCMQICRRSYEVKDKELGIELEVDNEYIMSPKDLKTIHFVNKMIDAGVRVFKIEGRARSAEYVKATVSSYKEAIRAYIDNTFTDDKIADWDKRLSKVFNRGFWDGYYLGQRLGEWSANYGSQATHRKVYIGKVTNYFKNIGVAEILVETQSIETGNEILITGETTGAYESIADDIRVNLISVNQAKKGDLFSIKTTDIVRRNDKVFKIVPAKNVSITQ